ncbi:MAG: hypothetical protein JNK21_06790 [Rhodospirillaceae bacterium]|nr:hypothetical protein [Rhodospirillaceae bacterium]
MGAILKLLLTVIVIAVAWYLIKFRGRIGPFKAAVKAAKKVAEDAQAAAAPTAKPDPQMPVKLVACPKCGTYVAQGKACACNG